MINGRHILILSLIYLSVTTDQHADVPSRAKSRPAFGIGEIRTKNPAAWFGESSHPFQGISKNRRANAPTGAGNNASGIDRTGPDPFHSFGEAAKMCSIHPDLFLQRHLVHNYPSHNFW